MLTTVRKTAITVAALGALGLGGAAIAGADDNTATKPAQTGTRPQREALAADVAAKVKAAALAKACRARRSCAPRRVARTGRPDHAHIKTSDGTQKVVLVNASFAATEVVADQGRGGKGGRGDKRGHGGRGGETALTGDTKSKVEAAVLAKYAGATIVRSETNNDSTAPYEAHIKTTDGKDEVLVSKDFKVVEAREHPAHR